jgi:hypothetical protein
MSLGESKTLDEQHRAIEKVIYIQTDSQSISDAKAENRPHGKVGLSGMTKPIIQWTLKSFLTFVDALIFLTITVVGYNPK